MSAGRLRRLAAIAKVRLCQGAFDVRYHLMPRRGGPFTVRSYDVFDTVLTRTVAPPTAVFLLTGRWARAKKVVGLKPGEFASARQVAERAARRGRPSGEVSLRDIYAELGTALALDAPALDRLLRMELAVEERVLCAVPGMAEEVARARMAGSTVAFVSDMYLDSEVVAGWLSAAGLLEPGDLCLLSHEHDATKASGALYDVLLGVARCRAALVCHLGDNLRSDVTRARRRRLVANHYAGTTLNRYEAVLAAAAGPTGGMTAAMAGAARLARLGTPAPTPHLREVRDVAAGVAAPVLTAYVLWVLGEAQSRGLRRLCFASRDGQVLLALAEAVAPRLGLDLELQYLYGGRQAWCLPGLVGWAEGSDELPGWVVEEAGVATAAGVLARVGVEPESVVSELTRAGVPPDRWHRSLGPAGVVRIKGALEEPGGRRQIGLAATRSAASLTDYLRQQGLVDATPWGVVDLGWRARATGALADVVDGAGGARPSEFYLGLRAGSVSSYARRSAWLFESPGRDDLVRDLPRVETLLEAFAAGDHGVVLGYQRDHDGRMAPVLQRPDNPAVEAWGLDTMRGAVARFAEALLVDDVLVDPWADLRRVAGALLRELWAAPTAGEAAAWGAFPYEDDPRGVQVRLLASPLGLSTMPGLLRGSTPRSHWRVGQERISSPATLAVERTARALLHAARR